LPQQEPDKYIEEQNAVRRLKDGDVSGLEWLVHQNQTKAVNIAFLITGDAQLAEDVVQDAFLRAYRSIAKFDENRHFAPWFMQIVSNHAIQSAQKQSNHTPVEGVDDPLELFERLVGSEISLDEQIITTEFKNEVWKAVLQLSPRQRAVIAQRYLLDMSEKEMASELGIAKGTVKWLLNSARKRLSKLLSLERKPE
jgi:RNA polymerase sigma factor (sigma-70 family)